MVYQITIALCYLIFALLIGQLLMRPATLNLAFRNVFRNRRRTIMALLAISIGTTGLIMFGGFVNDTYWRMREGTIDSGLGHLRIYKDGYLKHGQRDPIKYSLHEQDLQQIEELASKDPELSRLIKVISPELEFFGLAVVEDVSANFVGRAVLPARDELFVKRRVKEGSDLSADDAEGVALGKALGETLLAKAGNAITLLVSNRIVGVNGIDGHIKGVVSSGFTDLDKVLLKMPLALAWDLVGDRMITRVSVRLHRTEDTDMALARFKTILGNAGLKLEFQGWSELAQDYHKVVTIFEDIYQFIMVVITIIIVTLVANITTMSILERVPEIGTLRAMGTKRGRILWMFLDEGMLLGLLGGVIGLTVGLIAASVINIHGIPQSPPPGATFSIEARIRWQDDFSVLTKAVAAPLVAATLSAIAPAVRAARMNIAECFRHV